MLHALAVLALLAGAPDAGLEGHWLGEARHEGTTTPFALSFVRDAQGALGVEASLPAINILALPMGPVKVDGPAVTAGPFVVRHEAGVLRGTFPAALVPVYTVPFELRRVEKLQLPARRPIDAPVVAPAWRADLGAAAWAGVACADGTAYVGTDAGRVAALDPATGRVRWSVDVGGAVRARPTVTKDAVYVHADDGFLARLAVKDGATRWRVKVDDVRVERLPPGPTSRFDRWGSSAVVDAGRVYVGTHDGRLLALDAGDGRVAWSFKAGDSVLAAPALAKDRLVFGSYDGKVYAVAKSDGRLAWAHDTGKPVVSTPAVFGGIAVVGSRSYDLLGLDLASGRVAWKRYMWFTWVESDVVERDGVGYVGSSDGGRVYSFDMKTGRPRWDTDVYGWPWATPAVTAARVYAATSGDARNPAPHRAGVVALDRASGRVAWWSPLETPGGPGVHGVTGPLAVCGTHVLAADVTGTVRGFDVTR